MVIITGLPCLVLVGLNCSNIMVFDRPSSSLFISLKAPKSQALTPPPPAPPYGRFHRGREMTTSEMEFFCFAVKTPKGWIYFQTFCNLLYVSFFTKVRSSDFKFTNFTCWTWLKQPLNLDSKYFFLKFGVSLGAVSTHLGIWRVIFGGWF